MALPVPLVDEPRDLLLGTDNDLVIGADLSWSRGIQAVLQSCRIALLMFRGEWFLDLAAGIPYWQSILGQRPDIAIAIARDEYHRELMSVAGVLEVLRLDVDYERSTRTMTLIWQVRTALGETPVDTLAPEIP